MSFPTVVARDGAQNLLFMDLWTEVRLPFTEKTGIRIPVGTPNLLAAKASAGVVPVCLVNIQPQGTSSVGGPVKDSLARKGCLVVFLGVY